MCFLRSVLSTGPELQGLIVPELPKNRLERLSAPRHSRASSECLENGQNRPFSPCTASKGLSPLGNQETPPSCIVPSLSPLLT